MFIYLNNRILKGILFLLLSLSSLLLQGQESTDSPKARFSLEIDPVTFVFSGHSIHLRMQPGEQDHVLVGLGWYAMDLPSLIVDLHPENRDMGWKARIDQGLGLFAEHHFSEVNRGWFAGAQLGIQQFELRQEGTAVSSHYTNLLAMGYGGYSWRPFRFPLYLKGWAGVGYTRKMSGNNFIGESTYTVSPMTAFATLHLGYSF